jgi:hypothetical protein
MKAGNLVWQLGDKLIGNGEYLFGKKKDLVDLLSSGQVWWTSPSFVSESALSRLDWFQETRLPWSSHPNLAILTLHDQIVSDQSGSQLLRRIFIVMAILGSTSLFSPLLLSTFISQIWPQNRSRTGQLTKVWNQMLCTILPCYTNGLSNKIRGIFNQMPRFLFLMGLKSQPYSVQNHYKRIRYREGEREKAT